MYIVFEDAFLVPVDKLVLVFWCYPPRPMRLKIGDYNTRIENSIVTAYPFPQIQLPVQLMVGMDLRTLLKAWDSRHMNLPMRITNFMEALMQRKAGT